LGGESGVGFEKKKDEHTGRRPRGIFLSAWKWTGRGGKEGGRFLARGSEKKVDSHRKRKDINLVK